MSTVSSSVFEHLGKKEKVLCVVTQSYQDLVTAYLAQKWAKDNEIVFLNTGFEDQDFTSAIHEFFRVNGLLVKTIDARQDFKPLLRARTVEEKIASYAEAVKGVLAKLSAKYRARTLVAGNILSPSFEEPVPTTPPRTMRFKSGTTTMYCPLAGRSLGSLARIFAGLEASFALPFYPMSRIGLASQCVGQVSQEKMDLARVADRRVEKAIGGSVPGRYYFTAIGDNTKTKPKDKSQIENVVYNSFRNVGTVFSEISELCEPVPCINGWGRMLLINAKDDTGELFIPSNVALASLQERVSITSRLTRIGYCIATGNPEGKYIALLRHFESTDFNVAVPSSRNWSLIPKIGEELVSLNNQISACYLDISTKPPAKIGYI